MGRVRVCLLVRAVWASKMVSCPAGDREEPYSSSDRSVKERDLRTDEFSFCKVKAAVHPGGWGPYNLAAIVTRTNKFQWESRR